ncbi:sphingoid long chain base kinase-like protein [Xylaria bambusicola]|uniref:sphingoid long chain base kinase-like protein n=1 Tax=Xylaria bambusicola TaxID=326684 RepID=UPI002007B929|nr:sphingoid long chain base kinase-like protein [Xylaria bambusicola]KAI0509278.1 sphingoid long chain base kinase-like protein [Xylaria bambusicola]
MSESHAASAAADPASGPEGSESTTLTVGTIFLTLRLDGLNIYEDGGSPDRRETRFCGVPITKPTVAMTIPYYNVLWISAENEQLVIDYAAEKSKGNVHHARLKYSLDSVPIFKTQPFIAGLLNRVYSQVPRQRRAKVLINPHAGPGGATRLWENDVKPIFEAARMTLDVITTSRSGEGIDICEALDIDAYDVVVICSGDGLAYEAFNGFGKRPDARSALQKVAIAHIPCGSGNAMSCNLNGSNAAGASALAVVKGVRTPMDLMTVTQGDRRMLSFLSQSVGIIAEADLGTENMRWLGAKRFDLGVAQRIFSKKVYPCDIAVKVELENKDEIKAHYKRIQSDEEGKNNDEPSLSSVSRPDAAEGLPPLRFGTVNDQLPEDWQVASHDKLGNFYCGNMAWVAPSANFFPAACINDGLMDLVTNDGDIPILKYIDLMTSVENESFFDKKLLSYRKIVAYRFTPRNQTDGYISIDGERIPFAPFQVEIHPGLGTVLSKSGRYESFGPPKWRDA